MSELTERLKRPVGCCTESGQHFKKGDPLYDTIRLEAADEIERLTAELDALIELFRKLDRRGDPFDTFTQSVVREALDKHKEGK